MTDDNSILIEEFRRRLEALQEKLDGLKAKMGRLTAATATEFDRQMVALRLELESTRDEVKRLSGSDGEAWKDLEAGFEGACAELRHAFETATTRFQ